ncbi:hypothetical protein [Spirosoma validum]|uniref:Uncharacterized protein n=1 Tax=Spirosoma validum TaxID=2771355 RepID=A0A927B1W7_9BACT|nr:hypothetical protein [Spirosoma validum]MBD2753813.1 hypothetical protein [Spirosoma validum]
MKFRPILFKTEMVQALLAGTKTQTRRIVKPQPDTSDGRPLEVWFGWPSLAKSGTDYHNITPPFGRPGDVLWVKETYQPVDGKFSKYGYKADARTVDGINGLWWRNENGVDLQCAGPWKSSMFMPKEAARLFLQIKSIRVERLIEISEADAAAEGVYCYSQDDLSQTDYKNYLHKGDDDWGFLSPISSYFSLWELINGKGSLASNPFVWVVEFERIDKPADWK